MRQNASLLPRLFALMAMLGGVSVEGADTRVGTPSGVVLIELEDPNHEVMVFPAGGTLKESATLNRVLKPGDRLQTGSRSRATIRLRDLTPFRVRPNTLLEVPGDSIGSRILDVLRGAIRIFHRDQSGLFPIGIPTGSAIIRGTEFNLEVAADDSATLTLFEGSVLLTNDVGFVEMSSGDQATSVPGQAPRKMARIAASNVIQWGLYYPAVLHAEEIALTEAERNTLRASLNAYRAGDLLEALGQYPSVRQPDSASEAVYLAALWLSIGEVSKAEELLNKVPGQDPAIRQAAALRRMMAAVRLRPDEKPAQPVTASEWMAESYVQQSRRKLPEAREAARQATLKAPGFGFAWARLGELEFSFGATGNALKAAEESLRLSPRNAEALALRGFLLTAQNRIEAAILSFNEAIAVDGGLGNAWLGRGLCRIRQGDKMAALQDLETAALLEPQRALPRTYLGKAFAHVGDTTHATKELEIARTADPNDPTPWLYLALLHEEENRLNEAIWDFEEAKERNQNRSVVRSRVMLAKDEGVVEANLARLYHDTGLEEVSLWEGYKAVNSDYANYSAHLFLADSYQQQRELRSANQRYETPAVNEYLVASLLAAPGAGVLAHSVSQQEYSKLFETDGFHLASSTEYLSRGAWTQTAAQYGNTRKFGYALSVFYYTDPGQFKNNDLDQKEVSLQLQQQITPDDSIYFRAIYGNASGGDLAQYYNPQAQFSAGGPNTFVRFKETQEPILLAGYHHEWNPGMHTLGLAGRLQDTYELSNPSQQVPFVLRDSGVITDALGRSLFQRYHNELEIYLAEVQQIWQRENHSVIVGGRYQTGSFQTRNQHVGLGYDFTQAAVLVESSLERISAYAYHNWRIAEPLLLTVGVSYDRLSFPENFRFAPVSPVNDRTARVSPKAGFIWTPAAQTTVRFAFSQSLGGVTFDQSFRLEPVQVAGFNQAFRSLAPESVAGSSSATRFETFGLSMEQRVGKNTYLGLSGEILKSRANRVLGVYGEVNDVNAQPPVLSTRERQNYQERSILLSASQLVGPELSFGCSYRLSQAQLQSQFIDIPASATLLNLSRKQDLEALMHEVRLFGIFNHSSGFFTQADATWHSQHSEGYQPDLASDDFWQVDLFAGYRFLRRHAEVRLGILNVAGQDYRLNPLNITPDLARSRTLLASCRFYF
jgi:Tfp pilus assembly protein PilF